MIDTHVLPKPPSPATSRSESAKKTAMGAAAATQGVLIPDAAETDHHVTIRFVDGRLPKPSETPQTKSSAQRDHRNRMSHNISRRLHRVFAAEEVNLVSEVSQTFRGLK